MNYSSPKPPRYDQNLVRPSQMMMKPNGGSGNVVGVRGMTGNGLWGAGNGGPTGNNYSYWNGTQAVNSDTPFMTNPPAQTNGQFWNWDPVAMGYNSGERMPNWAQGIMSMFLPQFKDWNKFTGLMGDAFKVGAGKALMLNTPGNKQAAVTRNLNQNASRNLDAARAVAPGMAGQGINMAALVRDALNKAGSQNADFMGQTTSPESDMQMALQNLGLTKDAMSNPIWGDLMNASNANASWLNSAANWQAANPPNPGIGGALGMLAGAATSGAKPWWMGK